MGTRLLKTQASEAEILLLLRRFAEKLEAAIHASEVSAAVAGIMMRSYGYGLCDSWVLVYGKGLCSPHYGDVDLLTTTLDPHWQSREGALLDSR
jgi:hypothetical protein